MNEEDFIEKIRFLISLKKEGDYWDYKEEWHDDNEKLIHDILNFANTEHNHDCYLIIGVTDDGEIVGLNEEQQKEQANIIDTLRNCKFAGDNVPLVKLEKIKIEGKSLDVLVILNSDRVPFYLRKTNKKHRAIMAGFIYSRVGDTNTPISNNASVPSIEALWRKRFGINLTGLERLSLLLNNPNDWVKNKEGYYHLYNPEYSLVFGDYEERNPSFYSYCMVNESTSYQMVKLKYHGTILQEYDTAILDSGRYRVVTPDRDFIDLGNEKLSFRYYIDDSLKSKLNMLFFDEEYDEQLIAQRNFFEVVLSFYSKKEIDEFIKYVFEHKELFEREYCRRKDDYFKTDNEGYKKQIITGKVLKSMGNMFRQDKIE